MADVTISQLTPGIPAGNNILPYSTGSNTLGVPLSAILQNAGDVRLGGRLAIGAVDDPGPTQYNLELRGANPSRGVIGLLYNNAISPNNGAMIQYTQRGLGDWAMGCTAGGINGFSLYKGRGVNSDGTEAMRFDNSGNVEFFGTVKANQFGLSGTYTPQLYMWAYTAAQGYYNFREVTTLNTLETKGYYQQMGNMLYLSWQWINRTFTTTQNPQVAGATQWGWAMKLPNNITNNITSGTPGGSLPFIPGGYSAMNGLGSGNTILPHRWQSNEAGYLYLYGELATSAWTSSYLNFSASGWIPLQ